MRFSGTFFCFINLKRNEHAEMFPPRLNEPRDKNIAVRRPSARPRVAEQFGCAHAATGCRKSLHSILIEMSYPCRFATSVLFPLLLYLGVFGAASILKVATVTLYPVADTTLFEHSPNNNLGAESTLASGANASGLTNRALLRF